MDKSILYLIDTASNLIDNLSKIPVNKNQPDEPYKLSEGKKLDIKLQLLKIKQLKQKVLTKINDNNITLVDMILNGLDRTEESISSIVNPQNVAIDSLKTSIQKLEAINSSTNHETVVAIKAAAVNDICRAYKLFNNPQFKSISKGFYSDQELISLSTSINSFAIRINRLV